MWPHQICIAFPVVFHICDKCGRALEDLWLKIWSHQGASRRWHKGCVGKNPGWSFIVGFRSFILSAPIFNTSVQLRQPAAKPRSASKQNSANSLCSEIWDHILRFDLSFQGIEFAMYIVLQCFHPVCSICGFTCVSQPNILYFSYHEFHICFVTHFIFVLLVIYMNVSFQMKNR